MNTETNVLPPSANREKELLATIERLKAQGELGKQVERDSLARHQELVEAVLKLRSTVAELEADKASVNFLDAAGEVRISRVREGMGGPLRWDIEFGRDDTEVSSKTSLRDALYRARKLIS